MKHRNIIRTIFAAVAVAVGGVWADTETVGGYTWRWRINGDTLVVLA